MSEHIEEPWKKFRDASGYGISSINGDFIAEGLSEVDSDRIVACVNTLAGVPDELLQDDDKNIINRYTEHLKKETARQADLLAEVTEERDALLAAMKIVTTGTIGNILEHLHEFTKLVSKCEVQNNER